jgi:aconitate hydratase
MLIDIEMIREFYSSLSNKISDGRKQLNRPLTLAEKILLAHRAPAVENFSSEISFYFPDRIALRDLTSQLSLLQFASCGKTKVAHPTSVHCDHLILAESGAKEDLSRAQTDHREIFDFLQNTCHKFGIDFWKPGSGIIHQVVFENYAFPGGLIVGTDSFLPNSGGLGMLGIAIGASDIVGSLVGMACEIPNPNLIAVRLTGKLSGWAGPKDLALQLLEHFPAKGANGSIIEFIGEGTASISCSGKSTICNLVCEVGAISAVFPYDTSMAEYLAATGREEVATLAENLKSDLVADPEIESNPEKFFSKVIDIDLSTIEPRISGPNGSEKSWSISEFAAIVRQNGFPEKISVTLIGSCVNSSYEDFERAASIARQAWKHGIKVKGTLLMSPGSEKVRARIEQEGFLKIFNAIGCTLLSSSCGPCAGLWKRHDVTFGEKNSILTTFNRGSPGRHDGNPGTHAFVASPEIALALALAGRLNFNPLTDSLMTAQGLPLRFAPPTADALPPGGFDRFHSGYIGPSEDGFNVQIPIDPDSKRLQLLKPFEPSHERGFCDMRPLVKALGKVSVDQISPGGRWQRLRGHLENVSECIYQGVGNAFRNEIGKGKNLLTGEIEPFSKIARDYRREGIGWLMIAEENCGEGTSCEISALGPRHLGCKAVIAKSYAHGYESSLKRQGILTLSFAQGEDYPRIREDDLLDIHGLREFGPGSPIELLIKHADGSTDRIALKHSYNAMQASWFKAGSALNAIRG